MRGEVLRAVIFDLDDTLHDKSATLRAVAQRLHDDHHLARHGVAFETWAADFVAFNSLRIEKRAVFTRLADSFGLNATVTAELLTDFDDNLGRQAVATPGAMDCLFACKAAGLKVAVLTNGRDAFQRSKLAGMGALPLLDVIVTSGGFGMKKPAPAIFLACLAALGVGADEVVMVGDDHRCDLVPALALGMRAIWKSTSSCDGVLLSSDDFAEIQACLLGLA